MADLPEGFVDPQDTEQVTAVLDAVLRSAGPAGLLDLLARMPGVRVEAGVTKGFLRAAVPASTWLGPENQLVLNDATGSTQPTLVLQHVVGGITLSRETLPPNGTATLVARLLAETLAENGGVEDASAALTAHRDLFGPR
jgi:hypothetical protein